MRFTLRHLLLIFPAFFLAALIVQWWESQVFITYRYHRAIFGMERVRLEIDLAVNFRKGSDIPEDVIDQWLACQLPANHPENKYLREYPGLDPWRNPYKCVRNVSLPDGSIESIGILVYRGELPIELIDEFFSIPIIDGWHKLAPYVEDFRQETDNPQAWEWYQWLHERLAEHHKTLPRIPAHIR